MTDTTHPTSARRIDGKAMAVHILTDAAARAQALGDGRCTLRAIVVAPDAATRSYLRMKERAAATAGIALVTTELRTASTADVIAAIKAATETAVLVQLPLPSKVDRDAVLAAIPTDKDADALSRAAREAGVVLPPVAAAVLAVLAEVGGGLRGRRVTVVGEGWLVGAPVAAALRAAGANVTVVTEESGTLTEALSDAEIVISGAGVPNLITGAAIQPGAVVIDAGTSELGGRVVGDAAPDVALRASVITPVPGGVGPIAVACLMANVVTLAERARGQG